MSRAGALGLAAGVGGKIDKKDVQAAIEQYEEYHATFLADKEARKKNCTHMVNLYYNLVTSFYEYGWGESFHFANRWHGESLRESIRRHEHFIALQLGLKPGMKVLDVGCGIGGPLREIARFSSASITGININGYQISRGEELNRLAGLDKSCSFIQADFMKMPFGDDTFDAIFSIEGTCHAPDQVECYKEIYRVLKPGQLFAAYDWCIGESFDPKNGDHQRIKTELEVGNGIPDIRRREECLDALRQAGFEVIWEKDLGKDSPVPWYHALDGGQFSLSGFRLSTVGRFLTRTLVKTLEAVGLAPAGTQKIAAILERASDGVLEGGRKELFSPMYFFLVRKPRQ